MSLLLSRSGEDLSSYAIGKFCDLRLAKVGALLFKRIYEKLTICVKSLGGDRATEVAFSRFLSNEALSIASYTHCLGSPNRTRATRNFKAQFFN